MRREKVVNMIKIAVHQSLPGVQAILYGSEARGEARYDSDIDILLLVDKESISFDDRLKLNEPLYDIELSTGYSINTHFDTTKRWNATPSVFHDNVMRDGIVL